MVKNMMGLDINFLLAYRMVSKIDYLACGFLEERIADAGSGHQLLVVEPNSGGYLDGWLATISNNFKHNGPGVNSLSLILEESQTTEYLL